ncbi:phage baseplate assembly protein V [Acinetobacter cumulans]|uniref:Phage baseplate assembly protein V n=1 Tax=Acinetobacter cumulans TaxID=2136182 RepID=A0ABX9U7C3_9GAMM|nr:phage baseplate assembly protein V [Acinetobacter cumulans]RLL46422.1 phage baseplate assembly protein V [Acinetobacter cumulans]
MSAELHRRLENLIRFGTIKTIHPAKPFTTVTVTIGEITTAKLRFLTLRAGKTKTWDPPTVGEEVVVISPSGVLEMGVAIAGFNNKDNPSPSDNLDQTIRVFEDGCILAYDVSSHHLSAILPPGGTVELTANGGVTVNANGGVTVNANDGLTINAVSGGTTHNGNLTVNGSTVTTGNSTVQGSQLVQGSSHSTGQFSTDADVTAGDISLKSHKTSGVKSGSETSGEPIP